MDHNGLTYTLHGIVERRLLTFVGLDLQHRLREFDRCWSSI